MPTPRYRHAFSLSPLVVLLAALLILLLAARGIILYSTLAGVKATSAHGVNMEEVTLAGVITGSIVALLIIAAVGAGIATALYWIGGKSNLLANLGLGVVLLVPIALYGFQIYYFFSELARRTAAQQAAGQTPSQSSTPAERLQSLSEQNKEAMDRMARQGQAELERLRNMPMAQPPQIMPVPAPGQPYIPMRPTPPTPAPMVTGPGQTPGAGPVIPTPPQPENPAAKAVLDQLTTDTDAKVTAFLASADEVFTMVSKSPRASRKEIDDRIAKLTALRTDADVLAKWLEGLDQEAATRLKAAGLSDQESFAAKVRYSIAAKTTTRSWACRDYKTLADDASEEAALLRDNPGKWRANGSGITSTDRELQWKANNVRQRIESTVRRKNELADRLNGR